MITKVKSFLCEHGFHRLHMKREVITVKAKFFHSIWPWPVSFPIYYKQCRWCSYSERPDTSNGEFSVSDYWGLSK